MSNPAPYVAASAFFVLNACLLWIIFRRAHVLVIAGCLLIALALYGFIFYLFFFCTKIERQQKLRALWIFLQEVWEPGSTTKK